MVRRVAGSVLMLMVMADGLCAEAARDPLTEAMAKNPGRFVTEMADLVAGFGGPDGLTPDGIEDHIALERASARASALRRFLALDLDGDGSVTGDELATVQRAASAEARGRLQRQVTLADADGNGQLDASEIAAEGRAAALRALDEEEAQLLRAVIRLDGNGDGALTAAEIAAAVEAVPGG